MATLEDLDEASLKRILMEPKNALVKQYQRMFDLAHGGEQAAGKVVFGQHAVAVAAAVGVDVPSSRRLSKGRTTTLMVWPIKE